MKIENVKIKNFRSYYGENDLLFSTDDEKHVTIIHGENNVGKTAILNAIKWAFFENFTNNFRLPKILVNHTAKKNGIDTCSVQILFEEESVKYSLLRTYTQSTGKSSLKLWKIEGGVYGAALDQPEMIINNFVPSEMAGYFFFQGEGSNAIEVGNTGSNLAKSIRDILGFRVGQGLISDLKVMEKDIRQDISRSDTSGDAQRVQNVIDSREKILEGYKETKVRAEALIPALTKELEEVEDKLSQINNKDLNDLSRTEKTLESELVNCKAQIRKLVKEKHSNIGTFGYAVFGHKFANISLDFIDESQLKGRLPEPYNQTFIEDILEARKCICGTDLDPNSEAVKKITALLKKAANPSLQNRLSGIRAQIQSVNTLFDLSKKTISNSVSQLEDRESELEKIDRNLKGVKYKIGLIPELEIKVLTTKKKNLRDDITQQHVMLSGAANNIERITKELVAENFKLRRLSPIMI